LKSRWFEGRRDQEKGWGKSDVLRNEKKKERKGISKRARDHGIFEKAEKRAKKITGRLHETQDRYQHYL